MKDFYTFASANPWLTFFLLSTVCWCIAESIKHLMAPFKTTNKNEKARRTSSTTGADRKS